MTSDKDPFARSQVSDFRRKHGISSDRSKWAKHPGASGAAFSIKLTTTEQEGLDILAQHRVYPEAITKAAVFRFLVRAGMDAIADGVDEKLKDIAIHAREYFYDPVKEIEVEEIIEDRHKQALETFLVKLQRAEGFEDETSMILGQIVAAKNRAKLDRHKQDYQEILDHGGWPFN